MKLVILLPLLLIPLVHAQIYYDYNYETLTPEIRQELVEIEYKYNLNNPSLTIDETRELNSKANDIAKKYQQRESDLLEILNNTPTTDPKYAEIEDELKDISQNALFDIIILFVQKEIAPIIAIQTEKQQEFIKEYNEILERNNLPLYDIINKPPRELPDKYKPDPINETDINNLVSNIIYEIKSKLDNTWFNDYEYRIIALAKQNNINPDDILITAHYKAQEILQKRIQHLLKTIPEDKITDHIDTLIVSWFDTYNQYIKLTYNNILYENTIHEYSKTFLKYGIYDTDLPPDQLLAINQLTKQYQYHLELVGNPHIPIHEKQRSHLIMSIYYLPQVYDICQCVILLSPNDISNMDKELAIIRSNYFSNRM